jgi:hypothetical protein
LICVIFLLFSEVLMEPLALLNHAINFFAPAAWLACLMPLLGRFLVKNGRSAHTFIKLSAIQLVVCSGALVAGLLVFGHDGKMLTYLATVAVSASAQWALLKGWQG